MPSPIMSRASRIARALAMAAAASCSSSTTGANDAANDTANALDAMDAPPDVPGYMVVASQQGGYCVCCPSGDWSGNCYPNPMMYPDAGAPTAPPEGQRWCTTNDLTGDGSTGLAPACPIAGPLAPPEMPV